MPRKARFFVPGAPVHAVQRGHDRGAVFFDDLDYHEYLRCLKQAADSCDCAVHAYVLMTNHVHLLMTPARADSIARVFQSIGRHFVQHINRTYQRRGALWESRYKCNVIESEAYLFGCMRYIEMNPVRAGMVGHPAQYRWSSYGANGLGADNAVLSPHAEYLAIGSTSDARTSGYRALFDTLEGEQDLASIRAALQTGTPLGGERFSEGIEAMLARKVGIARRGRPDRKRERRETG